MSAGFARSDLETAPSDRPSSEFAALVQNLEKRLRGKIGFAALHLESGRALAVNAQDRFPMASTYKVPIASLLLALIDQGRVALDDMISITPRHFDETGEIAQSVRHPGVALSVLNLLELMLTQSNNNATDRILDIVGGPDAVTAWVRKAGINDLQVDRSVNTLLNEFYGFAPGAASMISFLSRWPTEAEREMVNNSPNPAFDASLKDTCTPRAMCDLLEVLFTTDCLSPNSRALLFDVMARCQTGPGRIKGLLPAGTIVAHKTGTIGGAINDVGVVMLPGSRGRLALAIFTRDSEISPYAAREPIMAELSRAVFDHFA
jgi:beta-lactamase class A